MVGEVSLMPIDVDAVYENGVLRLKSPVDLPEKAEVHVRIDPAAPAAAEDDDPTGWKTAEELIGCIDDGPEDGAANHDRYIYDDER
jgi:predicted DNA-binding antitoxin AbrB/MazE fold protein